MRTPSQLTQQLDCVREVSSAVISRDQGTERPSTTLTIPFPGYFFGPRRVRIAMLRHRFSRNQLLLFAGGPGRVRRRCLRFRGTRRDAEAFASLGRLLCRVAWNASLAAGQTSSAFLRHPEAGCKGCLPKNDSSFSETTDKGSAAAFLTGFFVPSVKGTSQSRRSASPLLRGQAPVIPIICLLRTEHAQSGISEKMGSGSTGVNSGVEIQATGSRQQTASEKAPEKASGKASVKPPHDGPSRNNTESKRGGGKAADPLKPQHGSRVSRLPSSRKRRVFYRRTLAGDEKSRRQPSPEDAGSETDGDGGPPEETTAAPSLMVFGEDDGPNLSAIEAADREVARWRAVFHYHFRFQPKAAPAVQRSLIEAVRRRSLLQDSPENNTAV
jgi:hypothetical protein